MDWFLYDCDLNHERVKNKCPFRNNNHAFLKIGRSLLENWQFIPEEESYAREAICSFYNKQQNFCNEYNLYLP